MKREIKDSVILGLSLFSIIFGAGNIIFSTYVGAYSGTKWPLSLIFFLIGDVFLVGLGLYAFIKNDNDEDKVFNKIGDIPSKILRIFMLACLGPLIAIPRTCAVSFEMFNFNNLIIFSIIYFILVFLFSFKSNFSYRYAW
jgi:Branched-chain amino acid permeases